MAALIIPNFIQELRSETVRHASEHIQRQIDNVITGNLLAQSCEILGVSSAINIFD